MKYFNTLKEFIDHVPNCLICGKQLNINIEGIIPDFIKSIKIDKMDENVLNKFVNFKTNIKNNILYGKFRNLNIAINVDSNEIISGKNIINSIMINKIELIKKCRTCKFELYGEYKQPHLKPHNHFPKIKFITEELMFMNNNKKIVRIECHFYDVDRSYFYIDDNYISTMENFNFSMFKNFKHMKKRIAMLQTFQ